MQRNRSNIHLNKNVCSKRFRALPYITKINMKILAVKTDLYTSQTSHNKCILYIVSCVYFHSVP
jgi:hypothetical protein